MYAKPIVAKPTIRFHPALDENIALHSDALNFESPSEKLSGVISDTFRAPTRSRIRSASNRNGEAGTTSTSRRWRRVASLRRRWLRSAGHCEETSVLRQFRVAERRRNPRQPIHAEPEKRSHARHSDSRR